MLASLTIDQTMRHDQWQNYKLVINTFNKNRDQERARNNPPIIKATPIVRLTLKF